MEPAADAATLDRLPRPLTARDHLIVETYRITGFVPRAFQVGFALAIFAGLDVVCVAGTGSGKSLAFLLIHFLCPDYIVWIISPLNVIENQMAREYSKYVPSVAVNASTLTEDLVKDIKNGTYKVVISSPECYKDKNKLRLAVLSEGLARKKHVTIVDEAHCIWTWGASGFRKDFERVGDMRVYMPDPGSPMCAATATLSSHVKDTVIRSLQIRQNYHDMNLGCWRENLCHGVRVMSGGQKSYFEVCQFFDSSKDLKDTPQAMIFVENYEAARYVAEELRKHYGLIGTKGSDLVPYYHSIIDEETKRRTERRFREGKARILVTTEALTMGADFPNVELIINFLTPMLMEVWLQRSGRGARKKGITCLCIILVTKKIVQNATRICQAAGIEVDPVLQAIKVEEDNEKELEEETADVPGEPAGNSKKRILTVGMAEFIATGAAGGCLADVIDRVFKNPPHTPCYDVGGCENCVKRQREQEVDVHQEERQELRQQVDLSNDQDKKLTHKIPEKLAIRSVAERARFTQILLGWRRQKLIELSRVHDTSYDRIMTSKELERIVKVKGIAETGDFDKPEVNWRGRHSWHLEVLVLLSDQQRVEDQQLVDAQEEA